MSGYRQTTRIHDNFDVASQLEPQAHDENTILMWDSILRRFDYFPQQQALLSGNLVTDNAKLTVSSADDPTSKENMLDTLNGENNVFASEEEAGPPEWIKYDLGAGNEAAVCQVRLLASNLEWSNLANAYTIQGSNDDSAWDTLATVTQSMARNAWSNTQFDNAVDYRYYRVHFTDYDNYQVVIACWQMSTCGHPIVGRGDTLPDAATHKLHVLISHATFPDGVYYSDGASWTQA